MAKIWLTREERDGRELLRHTLVQLTLQMKDQWRLKQQNPQDNQVKICIYVHLRISYIQVPYVAHWYRNNTKAAVASWQIRFYTPCQLHPKEMCCTVAQMRVRILKTLLDPSPRGQRPLKCNRWRYLLQDMLHGTGTSQVSLDCQLFGIKFTEHFSYHYYRVCSLNPDPHYGIHFLSKLPVPIPVNPWRIKCCAGTATAGERLRLLSFLSRQLQIFDIVFVVKAF